MRIIDENHVFIKNKCESPGFRSTTIAHNNPQKYKQWDRFLFLKNQIFFTQPAQDENKYKE